MSQAGGEHEAVAGDAVSLVLPRPAGVMGSERLVLGLDQPVVERRPPALHDAAGAARHAASAGARALRACRPSGRGRRSASSSYASTTSSIVPRVARVGITEPSSVCAELLHPRTRRVGVRAEGAGPQRVDVNAVAHLGEVHVLPRRLDPADNGDDTRSRPRRSRRRGGCASTGARCGRRGRRSRRPRAGRSRGGPRRRASRRRAVPFGHAMSMPKWKPLCIPFAVIPMRGSPKKPRTGCWWWNGATGQP